MTQCGRGERETAGTRRKPQRGGQSPGAQGHEKQDLRGGGEERRKSKIKQIKSRHFPNYKISADSL